MSSTPPRTVLSDQDLMEDFVTRPDLFLQYERSLIVYGWAVKGELMQRWHQQQTGVTRPFDYENMALYIREHVSGELSLVHDMANPGQLYLALWYSERDQPAAGERKTASWCLQRKIAKLSESLGCPLQAAHHIVDEANVYPFAANTGIDMPVQGNDTQNDSSLELTPAGWLPSWYARQVPAAAAFNVATAPIPDLAQQYDHYRQTDAPPAQTYDVPRPKWVKVDLGTASTSASAGRGMGGQSRPPGS